VSWEAKEEELRIHKIPTGLVHLDVGGKKFQADLWDLRSQPGFFREMFSGKFEIFPDSEGRYFLDRNGEAFGYVLKFLKGTRRDEGEGAENRRDRERE
jgi:hypothetical protein